MRLIDYETAYFAGELETDLPYRLMWRLALMLGRRPTHTLGFAWLGFRIPWTQWELRWEPQLTQLWAFQEPYDERGPWWRWFHLGRDAGWSYSWLSFSLDRWPDEVG